MKKRVLCLLIAIFFILSGCSRKEFFQNYIETTIPTSTPTKVVEVTDTNFYSKNKTESIFTPTSTPIPEPTVAPTVDVEWQTLTYNWEDEEGYQFEATIKVSPWINTKNTDYLNSAWSEVGNGKNLIEPYPKAWNLTYSGNYGFYSNTAFVFDGTKLLDITDYYYCVGGITIKNITDGWDITETKKNCGGFVFFPSLPQTRKTDKKYITYEETDSKTLIKLGNEKIWPSIGWVCPVMTSNKVYLNFICAHFDNKTPKYPDGQFISEIEDSIFAVMKDYGDTAEVKRDDVLHVKLSIVK